MTEDRKTEDHLNHLYAQLMAQMQGIEWKLRSVGEVFSTIKDLRKDVNYLMEGVQRKDLATKDREDKVRAELRRITERADKGAEEIRKISRQFDKQMRGLRKPNQFGPATETVLLSRDGSYLSTHSKNFVAFYISDRLRNTYVLKVFRKKDLKEGLYSHISCSSLDQVKARLVETLKDLESGELWGEHFSEETK